MAPIFPSLPLLVPMHLDALCIGKDDAKNRFNLLSGPSEDFEFLKGIGNETENKTPYLGNSSMIEKFGNQSFARSGVYLHWELPSTLTTGKVIYQLTDEALRQLKHQGIAQALRDRLAALSATLPKDLQGFQNGLQKVVADYLKNDLKFTPSDASVSWYLLRIVKASAQIQFPVVPNRWLVVRVPVSGKPHKAWVVESDFLSKENSYIDDTSSPFPGSTCIPLVEKLQENFDAGHPLVRYMGRVRALSESWKQQQEEPEYTPELTAVGYGTLSFAGYAPDCQNVFSFCDPMDDLPENTTETCSYVVMGWYDTGTKDPLQGLDSKALAKFLADSRWTVYGFDPKTLKTDMPDLSALKQIDGSVYYGMLRSVQWNAGHTYLQQQDVQVDAEDIDIVLANTAAEGLAAYLAKDHPETGTGLTAEEQLEALQLGILAQIQKEPEPEIELEKALHNSDFQMEEGGYLWTIAKISTPIDPKVPAADQFDAENKKKAQDITDLPDGLAVALNNLNIAQQQYDEFCRKSKIKRQQLYADWCQYLKWSYGTEANLNYNDKLYQLICKVDDSPGTDISDLEILETELAKLVEPIDSEKKKECIMALIDEIQTILSAHTDFHFELKLASAPRFYEPNDPVLLLVDRKTPFSSRFDRAPGDLLCRFQDQLVDDGPSGQGQPVSLAEDEDPVGQIPVIATKMINKLLKEEFFLRQVELSQLTPGTPGQLFKGNVPSPVGLNSWGLNLPASGTDGVDRGNPWHPVRLEWICRFHWLNRDQKLGYSSDYISNNATLDLDYIDLVFTSGIQSKESESYSGSLVLSRKAVSTLEDQADRYFNWNNDDSVLKTMVQGIGKASVLVQALHGFNDALLTMIKAPRLPVFDPYKTENLEGPKEIEKKTRDAVGNNLGRIPESYGTFNPIRAGFLEVQQLRIIDVFGQYRDIGGQTAANNEDIPVKLVRPHRLKPAQRISDAPKPTVVFPKDQGQYIALPPRLLQPTRLQFRLYSAAHDQIEMNDHPATTPVFGWVISNHLENSLMIYDAAGEYLGAIQSFSDTNAHPVWTSRPGGNPIEPGDIKHNQLKAFVMGLKNDTAEHLGKFRSVIERVLQTIEPAGYQQHDAMAVLMARPLALVQARLKLELNGPTYTACTIDAYTAYCESTTAEHLDNQAFTKVKFPIRLGDLSQTNDGLVGYFKATRNEQKQESFLFNYSNFQAEDNAENILLDCEKDSSQLVVLLLDPRAPVHASTGILPVKAIHVPLNQYSDTLKKIEYTFLVNPILSPGEMLGMPIPAESQQQWAWLSKDGNKWNTVKVDPKLQTGCLNKTYTHQELNEGWLRIRPFQPEKKSNNS